MKLVVHSFCELRVINIHEHKSWSFLLLFGIFHFNQNAQNYELLIKHSFYFYDTQY